MSTNISKSLPKDLTSYDFLKAFALILMIMDHVGQCLYPDEIWFRVLGRLCVPIWFFLIGYARTTEVPMKMWIGGAIVALSALVSGQFLLPLNILFSMAIARYFRHGLTERALHNAQTLRGMFLILVFAIIPTYVFWEYGSLGLLFVLMGCILRDWETIKARIAQRYLIMYSVLSFATFWLLQGALFAQVDGIKLAVLTLGLIFVGMLLFQFKPQTFPNLTKILPSLAVSLIQVMGRRTLEIYVCHIVILRVLAIVLHPEKFPFMDLKIVDGNLLSIIL